MKVLLACLCVLLTAHQAYGGLTHQQHLERVTKTRITQTVKTPALGKAKAFDMCPTCVSFYEEVDDILEDVVLNIGILDTCGVLCTIVEQKTGSQAIGMVCNLLCDIAGIEEFVKIITKADLDPIYFCELTKQCPIFDGGDAQITQLDVSPQKGPQGERTITFTFVTKNGTGTGQINMNVTTVDGFPVMASFLSEKQPAGTYPGGIKLDAEKADDCHPEQQPCERWRPGNYTVTLSVCNGQCFSIHPHSQIYDRRSANFTIDHVKN